MSQHAMLSPSGAYRWMTCPGSVALEADYPESSNEYSDEGTAAHAVAAMCLTENRPAAAYVGRRIEVGPHRTYEFREDMAEPVQTYVDSIITYRGTHELHVEVRVPVGHITGEQDAEGTSDVVIITDDQEEIQVHDLKFGKGVRVDAERNQQGMLYALGALAKFDVMGTFKRVRIVIHQPRLDSVSEWDCTIDELLEFAKEAKERAGIALMALSYKANWIGKDDSYLTPSDEACKFCKAKATCPALNKLVTDTVGAEFEVLATTQIAAADAVAFDTQRNDTADLSLKMKAIDIIESWCKAVRAEVERRLLAGEAVPDFKIVQGRQGNRAWSDPVEAEALLKSFRLRQEEMYSFKLESPTAIEKVLKESPKRWKKAEALITRSPGALSVAHVSDKRPAVEVKPAAEEFATLEKGADLV